ncbi:MAG TPA: hypothetical protein DCS07_13650 [Bdellovibrionales bacterium]|nr:MAG: hypothetical protein A2Z97_11660 [Bdellovibrionales bacterium GWB1_52_6]OFZ05381.1 MAG: hypothetical protein A2X97_16690 [Bdellovibrionales bacterium GWA1_52_35]OFZ43077.1 MAG: hypothetical protein A2070_01590 [Bdellovibrionales bacterium GWC1_52_8]HAR43653.1 hypothetical protein [Bdellovibrionales bacterium]HCM38975.1 hypothetical protein [Bdellovibrionales bacterium]
MRLLNTLILSCALSIGSFGVAHAVPGAQAEAPGKVLRLWGTVASAGHSVIATCLEISLDSIEPAEPKEVPISVCLGELPVHYAWKTNTDKVCAAYTQENVYIQDADKKNCSIQKARKSNCATCGTGTGLENHGLKNLSERILLADEGGGTSGGGDKDGLAAATRTLSAVTKAIKLSSKIYTEDHKNKLANIADKLRVVVVDRELSVQTGKEIQNSTAASLWKENTPVALLQRSSWNGIEKAIDREALLHHELCVLAGIESTGDYRQTNKYKEFRQNSWKFRGQMTQICSVSLFKATKTPSGKVIPGEPAGNAAIVMDWMGVKSGAAKLGNISKKRDIKVTYVISSSGYLRLKIVEADRDDKVRFVVLSNAKTLLEESVLIDPYGDELYPGTGTKNVMFGDHFLNVACTSE